MVQWVSESVDKSGESGMPGDGVEPYSRAGGKSVESCCLCIATSSVVSSQVFGGGPAGAVWSQGAIRKSCMQIRGEQTYGEICWQLCTCLSNPDLQSNFLLWPTLTWSHMGRGFWEM